MQRYIKNTTVSTIVRVGKSIAAGAYYVIPEDRLLRWANDDDVLIDIGSGDLVMARADDGSEDIISVSSGINFLKGIDQSTAIREEWTPNGLPATGGKYQAQSFELSIDQDQDDWKSLDVSFPYPISIFSTEWINETNFNGDIVQVLMAPDTIIGVITADAAIGSTVLSVSSTVTDNARPGYSMKLYDGTNQDDLGIVIEVDGDAGTITMDTPTVNAFAAATPSYIQQTIDFIPHLMLKGLGRVELAKDVVGGSYVPANTTIRIRYKNVEGTTVDKCFSFILEYKY